MEKIYSLFVFLLLTATISFAANISGKVTNEKGKGMSGVDISVEGTTFGT